MLILFAISGLYGELSNEIVWYISIANQNVDNRQDLRLCKKSEATRNNRGKQLKDCEEDGLLQFCNVGKSVSIQ